MQSRSVDDNIGIVDVYIDETMVLTRLTDKYSQAEADLRQHIQDAVDKLAGVPTLSTFELAPLCRPSSRAGYIEVIVLSGGILDFKFTRDLRESSILNLDETWSQFRDEVVSGVVERFKKGLGGTPH